MGKSQLFDNIMQVIHQSASLNSTTTVSLELDLELPRGYVAKLRKIKMEWDAPLQNLNLDDQTALNAALLLDPDDVTTIGFPLNQVQHDVIAEYNCEIRAGALTSIVMTNPVEWIYFEDKEDVITARNMRWNFAASGIEMNESQCEVTIYYTLEKIHDAQIMELLDIL